MEKIKLFLSSRVNSPFTKLDPGFSLEDLRQYLRAELEAQTFLDEKILDVKINEESFDGTISKDAFDTCMEVMRSCNIIVILYNGEAGWSIADAASTNGICHEEFLIAENEFSDMAFMLDLSAFFQPAKKPDEKKRNDAFTDDVGKSYPHMPRIKAKNVTELKKNVLTQVKQNVLKAVENSLVTQKQIVAGSSVFGDTLDWSKQNYSGRKRLLEEKLTEAFSKLPAFSKVIKAYHGIPDNMAVADARNLIGRPFVQEHQQLPKSQLKSGIIHFVAVYGNATATQIKNLVGYPDLTVIKGSFGYYLWEINMHIQMFFLIGCINPQTIRTRFTQVSNWLNSSREQANILKRANARYAILEAINKSKL